MLAKINGGKNAFALPAKGILLVNGFNTAVNQPPSFACKMQNDNPAVSQVTPSQLTLRTPFIRPMQSAISNAKTQKTKTPIKTPVTTAFPVFANMEYNICVISLILFLPYLLKLSFNDTISDNTNFPSSSHFL
jgi:hypothetical protein